MVVCVSVDGGYCILCVSVDEGYCIVCVSVDGGYTILCISVDGGYCMTCGSDKSVKLWNPHKGTLLHTYSGHGYEVLDARGSCDNSWVLGLNSD